MLHVEKSKNFTIKSQLELICEFRKTVGYKLTEIGNTIVFQKQIIGNRIQERNSMHNTYKKYLGINLIKHKKYVQLKL
jgi:hypothetical protein